MFEFHFYNKFNVCIVCIECICIYTPTPCEWNKFHLFSWLYHHKINKKITDDKNWNLIDILFYDTLKYRVCMTVTVKLIDTLRQHRTRMYSGRNWVIMVKTTRDQTPSWLVLVLIMRRIMKRYCPKKGSHFSLRPHIYICYFNILKHD